MRTRAQETNRYFATIWSLLALVMASISVAFLLDGHMPAWSSVVFAAFSAVAGTCIGFLHGITLFTARKYDAVESRDVPLEELLDDEEDYGHREG